MSTPLKITVAQYNFWVGNVAYNLQKILTAIQIAKTEYQSDLIVFPELALSGYPPEDLLFQPELHERIQQALAKIAQAADGIDVLLGYPQKSELAIPKAFQVALMRKRSRGASLPNEHMSTETSYGNHAPAKAGESCGLKDKGYNAAIWFRDRKILINYQKQILPNYGVFDEERYFKPGCESAVVTLKGISIGVLICEDIWFPEPMKHTVEQGAECVICLNASPFNLHKIKEREAVIFQRIQEQSIPLLYVHGVGGQDELIFDGGSLLFDGKGNLSQRAPLFQEDLIDFSFKKEDNTLVPLPGKIAELPSKVESAYAALVLGVRDYVRKNGFSEVLLGLSGGIDSALTLAIAVDALGSQQVQAVIMPSRYTAPESIKWAIWEAEKLTVEYLTISIEPVFEAFLNSLAPIFAGSPPDITEENLQARCRGMLLMALSNKTGRLVLTTGNKSEMALGYSTLYGDMAGGLDVLKDVSKTLVYELARYRNIAEIVIPQYVLERAPSAELAPNQRDEDTLPPYEILDQILENYIEHHDSRKMLLEKGFLPAYVDQAITRLHRNEYKRRQAPPGIRITSLAFGRDWRYPISSGY